MIQKIINLTLKHRRLLISMAVLMMFGYILWKLHYIINPQPNASYINSKRNANSANNKIQVKDSVKQQIEQLQETPLNLQPGQLGKPDPFSP